MKSELKVTWGFLMKALSFTLIIIGLLSFESAALAQTGRSPVVTRPCAGDELPGRPTLKRRQPTPDDSAPKEDSTQKTFEKEDCKPESETGRAENESKVAVRFEGLMNVDESDLRKDLREHRVQLPKDPVLEPDIVEKASAAIKEFLLARGYRHAEVNTRVEQTNADSKVLIFIVDQGPQPKIGEYRFEGNRMFPTQRLAEEARQCMAGFERDFYDPDVFDYCLHRLDNFARSQGYLQAHFHDPKVEETGAGLIVTLQASEGIFYRLGEIRIEGTSAFSLEKIRAMLPMKSGDIANGEQLSKWLFEKLKKEYGDNGYIQYSAEVIPKFDLTADKSTGVVDLEITIDEGKRFKVRKIGFKGEDLTEEQLLQLLLVHDGDIYNQTVFEKSIDRLNDTGLFEPIDKDRDVDYRSNEEEGLIDIVIKLTKRQN